MKTAALAIASLVLVCLAALITACGDDGAAGPGEIQTTGGPYAITRVDLGDRFPPDCSVGDCLVSPSDCSTCSNRLEEGTQVLAVWLEPKFEGEASLDELCGEEGGSYVTADDGSSTGCYAIAGTSSEGDTTLLFIPPASAKGFTLFLPSGASVELGK